MSPLHHSLLLFSFSTMADNEPQGKQPPVDPEAVVPQLESQNITYGDLQVAVRVLNAVASLKNPNNKKKKRKPLEEPEETADDDGLERYKHTNLRPLRKSLAACLELHQKTMFAGKDEALHYEERIRERSLKRQKMAERDLQKARIATTALRQGRVERLLSLQDDAKEEEESKLLARMCVPDGHVETTPKLLENGTSTQQQFPKLRSCYVCKDRFRDCHHFYDQLCPSCAAINWEKRHQTLDLSGKVAIVTGARVKIGLQTCLKLLRAGCTVVATTRFPNSAASVYREQQGFEEWKDRLQVYGLDLRDVSGLEAFTRFLKIRYGQAGVDIVINNACQTIRRPSGYYEPQVEKEQLIWAQADETHKAILAGCAEFERVRRKILLDHKKSTSQNQIEGQMMPSILPEPTVNGSAKEEQSTTEPSSDVQLSLKPLADDAPTPFDTSGLSHSAAMSQMIILPEDSGVSDSILPPGVTDINGQQLDLRTTNSWTLKLEEVSTPEIMECMFVNAIAPFVLNSRLKPLMTVPNTKERPDRFIVNVSAMEGKFYRYKTPNHPHTNMAKAALNMLTRTSAPDLAEKHRIYMNSVDTGWINDENPLEKASKTAANNHFQTPIDEIDAAARILDPIFVGLNTAGSKDGKKKIDYGKFLKDYRETEW
jgi:NAD(P)-dependent dehydrogenase (short-subunit alcohol dehydrogenase family)